MLLALVLWTFFCLWHSRCSLVCRLVKVQEKNVFNFPFWRQMPVKFCGVEDFPCVNEKSERNVIFWAALTRCGRAAGRRQRERRSRFTLLRHHLGVARKNHTFPPTFTFNILFNLWSRCSEMCVQRVKLDHIRKSSNVTCIRFKD